MGKKPAYLVTLEAEGAGPPLPIRLRRFLKGALRGYGLRCTSITEADSAPAGRVQTTQDDAAGAIRPPRAPDAPDATVGDA
jgi:hypothetical protein